MRGLRTPVSDLRKSIFTEVAKIAYEADSANLNDAVEAVPYTVCPGDVPTYRESIYRERAIAAERVRLAMGRIPSNLHYEKSCLYGHRINRYMLPVASKRAMWQKNIMSHLLCR